MKRAHRKRVFGKTVFSLVIASLWMCSSSVIHAKSAEDNYRSFCATCHGMDMSGGLGSALNDDIWKHGSSDEQIAQNIKKGLPQAGMPAWEKTLSDTDIRALIILMKERAAQKKAEVLKSSSKKIQEITAAGHTFILEKIAEAPGELWSMDILHDGRILASQKSGALWIFDKGVRKEITGIPKVWTQSQGGLLEVKAHPDAKEGWIYLSLSDPAAKGAMTKIVRGKLDGERWVKEETIFSVDPKFYTDAGVHFGSRIVFQGDYVFFSVGDRGQQDLAQDLSYPNGKIHRLHLDGKVPTDNPFVTNKNALPSIWSFGHRNPQGLDLQPKTGALWGAEHGPRGGDEINLIQKGANFGWPVITYGMNYNGTAITSLTHKEGMEQPKHYWVPSIAVSGIAFYTGSHFSKWQNHLLVGSLAKEQLRLVKIQGDKVIADELILEGYGRIRDVDSGPDGYPYVIFNQPNGSIHRLVPKS